MAEYPTDSELQRLLERSRSGDADAWSMLVAKLQGLVYSVPRRYRLDEDDAGDVFMTTFQALHRNLDRIESGRALPRWLATTAARESLRLARLKSRTTSDVPLEEIVAEEDASAEAEAVRSDDALRVRRALTQMAARCRDLLGALYADEETPYAEIAARLGVPIGAIGPTRARCLDKLRRTLESEGFFG
jgi:RNA polymerase sigma factor (sigma-70 family)